jgi:hypothetical protein
MCSHSTSNYVFTLNSYTHAHQASLAALACKYRERLRLELAGVPRTFLTSSQPRLNPVSTIILPIVSPCAGGRGYRVLGRYEQSVYGRARTRRRRWELRDRMSLPQTPPTTCPSEPIQFMSSPKYVLYVPEIKRLISLTWRSGVQR